MTEGNKYKNNFIKLSKKILSDNRYKDKLPYAYNIPLIDNKNFEEGYINASMMNGGPSEKDKNLFIATQGPLKKTIEKFWKLVIQKGIPLIVMLCQVKEDLRVKCEIYWPESEEEQIIIESMDMVIKLTKETEIYDGLIKREFKLYKDQKEIREITQIQMKNWPDHNIPKNKTGLRIIIDYIDKVKSYGNIIIHCSAGSGRTGCLIAIYNIYQCFILLKQINEELQRNIKPFFSVFNICRKLREQRQGMISNYQQYKFVYEYSAELAKDLFFN